MPAHDYPYVDIVVLDAIRERFARGDALVLLTPDLDTVIWANGSGASLFGAGSIETFMGTDPGLSPIERRQIGSAGGPGRKKASAGIRLSRGFSSRLVNLDVVRISLPLGEPAILLATHGLNGIAGAFDIAEATVSGFESPDAHLALVGRDGAVIGASNRFRDLGIARGALADLVADVRAEADRLVKRPLETSDGFLPAAIARLSDRSGLHLVMVVDDVADDGIEQGEAMPVPMPAPPEFAQYDAPEPDLEELEMETVPVIEPIEEPVEAAAGAQAEDEDTEEGHAGPISEVEEQPSTSVSAPDTNGPRRPVGDYDGWYFGSETPQPQRRQPTQEAVPPPLPPRETPAAPSGSLLSATEPQSSETDGSAAQPAGNAPRPADQLATDESGLPFAYDPSAGPVRFVWKTAPDGTFREISGEFTKAVGPNATDVIGRKFSDVARVFALDPTGEIAALIGRRDTWSGRSVLWPIQGTDLKVPVDLAALPVYDRARNFDGFRGFGVARMGDAVVDPDAIGLALSGVSLPPQAPILEEESETPAAVSTVSEPAAAPTAPAPAPSPSRAPAPQKVIDLSARRRDRSEPALSPNEESAFQEIGARLREDGTPEDDTDGSGEEPQSAPPVARIEGDKAAARDADRPPATVKPARPTHEPAAKADAEPTLARPDEVKVREYFDTPRITREGFIPSAFARGDGPGHATLDEDVLSVLPIAIVVHDGHKLLYVNDEFLRLTGYRNLKALQKAGGLDVLFADAEDPLTPRFGSPVRLMKADKGTVPVEARLHSIRWRQSVALLLSMRPVAEEPRAQPAVATATTAPATGKPVLSIVTPPPPPPEPKRPVVATREAVAEINELKAILDTATDGVILVDDKGKIRSLNRSAQALFGYDVLEMKGKPFEELFATESRAAAADYLQSLAENGITSVLNDGRELTAREKMGRFIPVFMTMGRLQESHGYCAVLRDITQFKRTEFELERARKSAEKASEYKSEFLARVSHEVRTPLNAIIGFSEIMLSESFGPIGNARYRDYLEDINASGNHVLQIINDLLDISKIEAGQQDLNYEAVRLNEVISDCVSMMQPAANRERVIVRTSLSPSVPDVVADLRSVRQIALNLLSNAIRFTQAGGQIIVSTTYEKSGEVTMKVRDTGVGMTDIEIEQALKPFKQVPSAKSRDGEGTGLGLPLTKAMAEANRASFAIHSAPGEGTVVSVTFPSTRVLAD